MRRSVLLVACALVLVAVPAVADHVNESTLPLTSMRVRSYEYPNLIATQLRCDGTDKITFNNLRVEPLVTFEKDGRGGASEHWTQRISVLPGSLVNGVFRANKRQGGADTMWHHQNVPPHFGRDEYETQQWNTYLHRLGYWEITVLIAGEESGNTFTDRCVFEKVG